MKSLAKRGGLRGAVVVLCTAAAVVLWMAVWAQFAVAQIRVPSQSIDGETVYNNSGITIDYGNSSQGYVMVKYSATDKRLKLRITKEKKNYTYDLNNQGMFEIIPLQMGDGKYKIQVFREAKANKYTPLGSKSINVKLQDPNIVYLYPNQFVNYTENSAAVTKSLELCAGLNTDAEKVEMIFDFCRKNIVYHFVRATSPNVGYLPNIDAVLAERKGICFDYAAVMACMLRVQNIPTQLVIGNADTTYHAWNHVLIDGKWYRYDATFASLGNSAKNYTEERRY